MNSHPFWLMLVVFLMISAVYCAASAFENPSAEETRRNAQKEYNDGNYNDAYALFAALALDPDDNPELVGNDLNQALYCLNNLGRTHEMDAFREKVIDTHTANWRLLAAAADTYMNFDHHGYVVAGEFYRGYHQGGGQYVSAMERDRVRALQLFGQAMPLAQAEADKSRLAAFYLQFARMIAWNREGGQEYKLQVITDIEALPDYEEGYYYGHERIGAPQDKEGNPVFYKEPIQIEEAANDGERRRWLLEAARNADPNREAEVLSMRANFLHSQFGVHTLSGYGGWFNRDPEEDARGSIFSLHNLTESETIAKLAGGIKRLTLPDEFNFVKLYRRIAEGPKSGYSEGAWNSLAGIFENRRQYDMAAECWLESIERHGDNGYKRDKRDQILGNYGQFEPIAQQPAGRGATVDYRFRNGNQVHLEAFEIRIDTLLGDIKDYLKDNPSELDWNKINLGSIGHRLVTGNADKYIDKQVAKWGLDLEPRANHFDKRITITTPLQKAGAYLVTAEMKDGNTSKIVLWVHDTVIVKKPLDGKTWLYVADAVSGEPISRANVEFFGYRQERVESKLKKLFRRYNVLVENFAEFSGDDGQLVLDSKNMEPNYNWLITATTESGRLAFLGFTNVWYSTYYHSDYDQLKTIFITDRPVYRPDQTVKFKAWMRQARYDLADQSLYANRSFLVTVRNPRNEKILEQKFTTDDYGGLDGEIVLPRDAILGTYQIWTDHGQSTFRVEEYKKPEFEVTVEAPTEPVTLGEKITATIKADYYFGAPVTNATVKYKVFRTSHTAQWYPIGLWDWFYGSGYWWFAYDYIWYPGWDDWGMRRPHFHWFPWHQEQPEMVLENEVEINEDGTVEVVIDTAFAKEVHGDQDHAFRIEVEVRDESRRTIMGQGQVLAARKPFKVYAWVDRGYYHVGDEINASFSASTLDQKPVKGKGKASLLRVSYDEKGEPRETAEQTWELDTNDRGDAKLKLKASRPGQYRLAFEVTDAKGHTEEGGYLFVVRGEGFDGSEFRFNDLELIADRREYKPGEQAKIMINTNRAGSTVLFFQRPANGIYKAPKLLRLEGKSAVETLDITVKDMPNAYVEALTISNGRIYTEIREIIVPPEQRVVDVEVMPSQETYLPGENASIRVLLKDIEGKPIQGSCALTVYDKALEYISGGSNVPEIRSFFWKWRRHHNPHEQSSLQGSGGYGAIYTKPGMQNLGVFGFLVVDDERMDRDGVADRGFSTGRSRKAGIAGVELAQNALMEGEDSAMPSSAPMERSEELKSLGYAGAKKKERFGGDDGGMGGATDFAQPMIRKAFADAAYWAAAITTDEDGFAEVEFTMPENLTAWKIKTWAMGHGTRVGEGSAEVTTTKNLLLRLQAPRFFVERDEVVLSANIHNYLEEEKTVKAVLELDGETIEPMDDAEKQVAIPAGGELRVDWRVKVTREGEAVVRMKALSDTESDAMEMRFPVFVHGMAKTDSFSGAMRSDENTAELTFRVPEERRVNESLLVIRYSPTLAGAMVDALPYLAEYPYGCTEQTLNRFLPSVITQKILLDMGLSLADIRDKQVNLNAQEIGDPAERAARWKVFERNPVFDEAVLTDMVKTGLKRLTAMQLSDGGWGWFSGWGEHSYPHTTAVVVHGLQAARENDVALVPGMLEQGIEWLTRYQAAEIQKLKNAEKEIRPYKTRADDMDAYIYMVLGDEGRFNEEMETYLYRDRKDLSQYSKAMFGLALHKQGRQEKLDMIVRNLAQFVNYDEENQTAWLTRPGSGWWYWYGSEYEALAYYLKLLSRVEPKGRIASGLAKYLINNRRHGTYWNSTRDTALCIEALADFMRASGEDKPDMTIEIFIDGNKHKEVKIDGTNLFVFDGTLLLKGDAVEGGEHTITFKKTGSGPLYFNAYLTCFTLEDHITRAGLEVKVNRKVYKLVPKDKQIDAAGAHGQVVKQKVEKYERILLDNLAVLKSGDLVEIELEIDSKNDYEYLIFEDMKAAGFEPVDVRSGYTRSGMSAYRELRDERVSFFVRMLNRGKHSVSYRVRAEIPGRFSALPARAYAMYAPELKGNSDEIKLQIVD